MEPVTTSFEAPSALGGTAEGKSLRPNTRMDRREEGGVRKTKGFECGTDRAAGYPGAVRSLGDVGVLSKGTWDEDVASLLQTA